MRNQTFEKGNLGPHTSLSKNDSQNNKPFEGGFVEAKTLTEKIKEARRTVYLLYKVDKKFRFWSQLLMFSVLMIVMGLISLMVN